MLERGLILLMVFALNPLLAKGKEGCAKSVVFGGTFVSAGTDFYVQKPLPIRSPKEAALAKLGSEEVRKIIAAHGKMAALIEAFNDGSAMNDAVVAYYQVYVSIGMARRKKLETLVTQVQRFVEKHLAEPSDRENLRFAVSTGVAVEGEQEIWNRLEAAQGPRLKQLGAALDAAKQELLAISREKLAILNMYVSLLNRCQASIDHPSYVAIHGEQMNIAETILSWNGLMPERITFRNGKKEYQGITWQNDHRTELGELISKMAPFEKGRTYQVVYAPRYTDEAHGAAAITSEQSPRQPDILAVSNQAIAMLKLDSPTQHELRHAEGFRLRTLRIDWNLQAEVVPAGGKLPEVAGAPTGHYTFQELYTLIANIQGDAKDALNAFRSGDLHVAEMRVAHLADYSAKGYSFAEQINLINRSAQKTLSLSRERWEREKSLHPDTIEFTNVFDEMRVIQCVGANEANTFGFATIKNVLGEDFVRGVVYHEGLITTYDFMDAKLVPLVGAQAIWNEELTSLLERRLQSISEDVPEYQELYRQINNLAYSAFSNLNEADLVKLKTLADRFSEFTFTNVPKIRP